MPLNAPALPELRDPAWTARLFWSTAALAVLWPLLVAAEFKPWVLFDERSREPTLRFLSSFAPPAHSADFLWEVLRETWRTIAIATAGITLALLLAVPMSLLSARSLSISALLGRTGGLPGSVRQVLRWTMVLLRSIPEIVWALVLVRVVGLGPSAGVLAIALTYGGMLGKVYTEILESNQGQATQTLLRNGSGRLQAFAYALAPQCAPELISYTVYRWECAIRSSVVLGFVGAGGLGQLLDSSVKNFAGAEVATMLLVFVALVALADRASLVLRKALN